MYYRIIALCFIFFFCITSTFSQINKNVIVKLKNGYTTKGILIEQSQDQIKIQLKDSSYIVYQTTEIDSISEIIAKELILETRLKLGPNMSRPDGTKALAKLGYNIGLRVKNVSRYHAFESGLDIMQTAYGYPQSYPEAIVLVNSTFIQIPINYNFSFKEIGAPIYLFTGVSAGLRFRRSYSLHGLNVKSVHWFESGWPFLYGFHGGIGIDFKVLSIDLAYIRSSNFETSRADIFNTISICLIYSFKKRK